MHAGHLSRSISLYAELLSALQPTACSGLYAHVLCKKATAHKEADELEAALQCLSRALELEPGSLECLHLRAMVRHLVHQMVKCFEFTSNASSMHVWMYASSAMQLRVVGLWHSQCLRL